jgi:hypothetical protein
MSSSQDNIDCRNEGRRVVEGRCMLVLVVLFVSLRNKKIEGIEGIGGMRELSDKRTRG